MRVAPLTFHFADDGLVPNSRLPLVIYPQVIAFGGNEPEAVIERLFAANRWGGMWRNGIFDYLHFHATAHEALGIARGSARVRFGGEQCEAVDVRAGDVAILPAGTGHQCLNASADFSVVGAYPRGQRMEITRPTPEAHAHALKQIRAVALPEADPVDGQDGPLMRLWR